MENIILEIYFNRDLARFILFSIEVFEHYTNKCHKTTMSEFSNLVLPERLLLVPVFPQKETVSDFPLWFWVVWNDWHKFVS